MISLGMIQLRRCVYTINIPNGPFILSDLRENPTYEFRLTRKKYIEIRIKSSGPNMINPT